MIHVTSTMLNLCVVRLEDKLTILAVEFGRLDLFIGRTRDRRLAMIMMEMVGAIDCQVSSTVFTIGTL